MTRNFFIPRKTTISLLAVLCIAAALTLSGTAGAGTLSPVKLTPLGVSSVTQISPLTSHPLEQLKPQVQVSAKPLSTAAVTSLPTSVDLSSWAPTSRNQGALGSCVTWAIDYGMLGWYERHDRGQAVDFNPMYTFAQVKQSDGQGGYYAPQPATLNVATVQGNDTFADDPQNILDYTTLPTSAQRANAANYRVTGAQELFSNTSTVGGGLWGQQQIQAQLAANHPVAIAFHVRQGFDALNATGHTGYYDSDYTTSYRGNHEVLAVAYDSYGLWILNSWGTGFGRNGYAELSWDVVQNDVFEAAVISGFASSTADTTKPVVSTVGQVMPSTVTTAGSAVDSVGRVPVRVSWSASDAGGSGLASYSAFVSVNGTWTQLTTSGTATSTIVRLAPGTNRYQFAVRAIDGAGNQSDWTYGTSFTLTTYQESSSAIVYTGSWGRYAWTSAFGGYENTSSTTGSTATFTFTGRNVAWIAPTASNRGTATVSIDGTAVATRDLYSSTAVGKVVDYSYQWATNGTHTIRVRVNGTTGRPAIDVDAFVVMS